MLLVNSPLLFTVLGHVIEPIQDNERAVIVVRVMTSNEFQLLGMADDIVTDWVNCINEKLLGLSVAGIYWPLLFQFLGLLLLGNASSKS